MVIIESLQRFVWYLVILIKVLYKTCNRYTSDVLIMIKAPDNDQNVAESSWFWTIRKDRIHLV